MHTSAELGCLYCLTRQRVVLLQSGSLFPDAMATVMKLASLMLRLGLQLLKEASRPSERRMK